MKIDRDTVEGLARHCEIDLRQDTADWDDCDKCKSLAPTLRALRAALDSLTPSVVSPQAGQVTDAMVEGALDTYYKEWIEYAYPLASSGDSAASSQRALVEAGKSCYESLAECVVTLRHARTFIASREKMHPDGIGLYDADVTVAQEALAAYTAALDAAGRGS